MRNERNLKAFRERVPTYDELNWPALQALKEIGGSGSISEHLTQIIESYQVPDSVADITHLDTGRTELEYRLAWARTALRRCGFVENSARGVWSVTEEGEQTTEQGVRNAIASLRHRDLEAAKKKEPAPGTSDEGESGDWKDILLSKLRRIEPSAFERLAQRLLRESGFVKVEVTGRSSDGGIDGTGILQLSLMSFHVLFQCKRYQGSVGAPAIRDFRGAMMGRTDKGVFITTGHFSPEARREATRDGAPPIDLIDGASLCEKLKDLQLGVQTRLVEEVEVLETWYDQI